MTSQHTISSRSSISLTWYCIVFFGLLGAVFFAPAQSLAGDSAVEMPPTPGQVYQPQGQSTTGEASLNMPAELQQLDKRLRQEAAVLSGEGAKVPAGNQKGTDASLGERESPLERLSPIDKDENNLWQKAGLIAIVMALGLAGLLLLRRRGR